MYVLLIDICTYVYGAEDLPDEGSCDANDLKSSRTVGTFCPDMLTIVMLLLRDSSAG